MIASDGCPPLKVISESVNILVRFIASSMRILYKKKIIPLRKNYQRLYSQAMRIGLISRLF